MAPGRSRQGSTSGTPRRTVYAGSLTAIGSIRLGSLFLAFPTRALTGQHVISSEGQGANNALLRGAFAGSSPSQTGQLSRARITGVRSKVIDWHQAAAPLEGILADHRQRVGWRHVPTQRDVRRWPMRRDREDQFDLADIGGEAGAATHGASIAGPKRGSKRPGLPHVQCSTVSTGSFAMLRSSAKIELGCWRREVPHVFHAALCLTC